MPLYEYECDACGLRFELIRKFSDSSVDVCTLCGKGPVRRLFSSPAIQFKGSGFYITDYAKKGEGGKGEAGRGEGSSSDKTSAEKTQDTKSDSAKGDKAKTETASKSESPAPATTPTKTSGGAAKD